MIGPAAMLKTKGAFFVLLAIGLTIKVLLLLAMLTGALALRPKR